MPVPISTRQDIRIVPLQNTAGFGCEVFGADLNTLDEETFQELQAAVYTYRVVIIRDQKNLIPQKQVDFNSRFDPNSPRLIEEREKANKSHGQGESHEKTKNVVTVFANFTGKDKKTLGSKPQMPAAPLLNFIGSGDYPAGFSGIPNAFTMVGPGHQGFHRDCLTDEEMEAGITRFQRWHIDAALYGYNPSRITSYWVAKLSKGPDGLARWDDGSGLEMPAPVGRTSYIDSAKLYQSISEEDRKWVDFSSVEYFPHPYQTISNCRASSNGLGLYSEGKELPLADLPAVDPAKVKVFPMIWPNPLTGEKALQFHAVCACKIHYKTSADGEVKIIDDLPTVRKMLYDLQVDFFRPENIIFPDPEEGDLLLWFNRGVRHSAVQYKDSLGPRFVHQLQLYGSDNPGFPDPVEGLRPISAELIAAPKPARKTRFPIVLGGMTFGNEGTDGARVTTVKGVEEILDVFMAHGHDELDNARSYGGGSSEELIGQVAAANKGLKVGTKLYPNTRPGMPVITHNAADLRKYLDIQMKAMGAKKLSMWYLNAPDKKVPFEETIETIDAMYKEGLFTAYGLSNYKSWEVARICEMCDKHQWVKPVAYQGPYNALNRLIEPELIPCLRYYGLSFSAYNILAGGLLTDRYTLEGSVEAGARYDPLTGQGRTYRMRYWNATSFAAIDTIKKALGDMPLTEAVLRWASHHSVLKPECGDSICVGASSAAQLEEVLAALEKGPLTPEVVKALDAASAQFTPVAQKFWH